VTGVFKKKSLASAKKKAEDAPTCSLPDIPLKMDVSRLLPTPAIDKKDPAEKNDGAFLDS